LVQYIANRGVAKSSRKKEYDSEFNIIWFLRKPDLDEADILVQTKKPKIETKCSNGTIIYYYYFQDFSLFTSSYN